MRILLYNRHFFPSIGGTEMSGRIMARELAELGHDVTVVTATQLPDQVAELNEGYTVVRREQITTLVWLARENDVLFSRGGVSLRAFFAAVLGRIPFVVFHESDAAAVRAGISLRLRATDVLKSLVCRQASVHVLVSDALLDMLALPRESCRFRFYNPVPVELWTTAPDGPAERNLDIVFVGRLVADKGITVLRDALLGLPGRGRLRVAIAGSGDTLAEWQRRFREVCGEVTFLGPVTGTELRDLYQRARIVVMPSVIKEGMGMVAAEAIANGTPVCASDQPALREVIGDAGLYHPMGDACRLAADINRLLSDPGLWQVLSARTLAVRARFSMTQYRKNLAALVDKIGSLSETSASVRTPSGADTRKRAEGDDESRW